MEEIEKIDAGASLNVSAAHCSSQRVRQTAPIRRGSKYRNLARSMTGKLTTNGRGASQRLKPDDIVRGFAVMKCDSADAANQEENALGGRSRGTKGQRRIGKIRSPGNKVDDDVTSKTCLAENGNDTMDSVNGRDSAISSANGDGGNSAACGSLSSRYNDDDVNSCANQLRSSLVVSRLIPPEKEIDERQRYLIPTSARRREATPTATAAEQSAGPWSAASSAKSNRTVDFRFPHAGNDVMLPTLPSQSHARLMLVVVGRTGEQRQPPAPEANINCSSTNEKEGCRSDVTSGGESVAKSVDSSSTSRVLSSSFTAAMLRYGAWNRPTRQSPHVTAGRQSNSGNGIMANGKAVMAEKSAACSLGIYSLRTDRVHFKADYDCRQNWTVSC
jgi:hypothetical protein